MPHATVTVIIVNYNAGKYLARCLEALFAQTFSDFHAILADNGSTDGSMEGLPADSRLEPLLLGANTGFAVANNRAAAMTDSPLIALLNPDAFAEPGWLAALVAAAERHPDAAMFGSTQIDALHPHLLDGTGDHYFAGGIPWRGGSGYPVADAPSGDVDVFAPCAAAALYRREAFDRAGGFDERFFCYCEDVDLAFRIRLDGGRCIQVRDAVVHHVGSAITGRRSAFSTYHGMRNRLWLFVKNMPPLLFWPLLPVHALLQSLLLCKASSDGVFDAALKGFADGLSGISPMLHSRRMLQRARRASTAQIARALVWSPVKLWKRGI